MKRLWNFSSCLMLALIVGCASLGIETDTVNKKLSAAYTTVNIIGQTANTLAATQKITKQEASSIYEANRAALNAIDMIAPLAQTNPDLAITRLTPILAALQATQAYLLAKGVPQ